MPAPRPSTGNSSLGYQRPPTSNAQKSRGIQTGNSLFRQFREKKDKACYVRERPQAYFIECDEGCATNTSRRPSTQDSDNKTRPKSAAIEIVKYRSKNNNNSADDVTTTIIDLETETLPKEKNLQEALKQKRPDYIAKTKTREQDRLARSMVQAANKQKSTLLPSKVKGSAFRYY